MCFFRRTVFKWHKQCFDSSIDARVTTKYTPLIILHRNTAISTSKLCVQQIGKSVTAATFYIQCSDHADRKWNAIKLLRTTSIWFINVQVIIIVIIMQRDFIVNTRCRRIESSKIMRKLCYFSHISRLQTTMFALFRQQSKNCISCLGALRVSSDFWIYQNILRNAVHSACAVQLCTPIGIHVVYVRFCLRANWLCQLLRTAQCTLFNQIKANEIKSSHLQTHKILSNLKSICGKWFNKNDTSSRLGWQIGLAKANIRVHFLTGVSL